MSINRSEFFDSWMPWRVAEGILPRGDGKNYDAWTRQGFVPSQIGESSKTGSGRGKARTYSLASCIGLATMWELFHFGYKPSACTKVIEFVIEIGQEIAEKDEDTEILEDPCIVFYEMENLEPTNLTAIHVDREILGAWVASPTSKEARPLAQDIEGRTKVHAGALTAYFVFEAGYVINRIIESYRMVKLDYKNE